MSNNVFVCQMFPDDIITFLNDFFFAVIEFFQIILRSEAFWNYESSWNNNKNNVFLLYFYVVVFLNFWNWFILIK